MVQASPPPRQGGAGVMVPFLWADSKKRTAYLLIDPTKVFGFSLNLNLASVVKVTMCYIQGWLIMWIGQTSSGWVFGGGQRVFLLLDSTSFGNELMLWASLGSEKWILLLPITSLLGLETVLSGYFRFSMPPGSCRGGCQTGPLCILRTMVMANHPYELWASSQQVGLFFRKT